MLLHGISTNEARPRGWGGFADVYMGEYQGVHVAIKRLKAMYTHEADVTKVSLFPFEFSVHSSIHYLNSYARKP
jgi:hypothetical protein